MFAALWRSLRRRYGQVDLSGSRRDSRLRVQIGHLEKVPFKAWAKICHSSQYNDEICDYIGADE
jgi:hypothetical protein